MWFCCIFSEIAPCIHVCLQSCTIPSTKKWRILWPWRPDIWEYFSGHEHISLALLPWAYKFKEYCRTALCLKTKQISHKFNCFRYQFNYSMLTSYGLCTNGGIFSYLQWRPVVLIINYNIPLYAKIYSVIFELSVLNPQP